MKRKHAGSALLLAAVLALSLLLGACGGKDGADGAQKDTVEQDQPGTDAAGEKDAALEEDGSAGTKKDAAGTEGEEGSQEENPGDGSDPSAAPITEYPVTVTDQLGREVVIEKEPQTIVSGYYISSSLLMALGQQDKLVGIEAKADKRPIYSLAAPKLLELPSVGTAKEFDLEGCAALSPDLVIVPAKLKETIPALEELGLTVLAVKPEDRQLFTELAQLLGVVTNTQGRAAALIANGEEELAELTRALEGIERPTVYLAGNSSFLSTAGEAMYQNSLITQAGGTNVAAELADTYWAEISYEQLLAWNPEYIILAAEADYTVESVLADEQLAECAAVKNGHVYQIPGQIEAWDSPVPGSVMGSLWLTSVLHPESYSPQQYQQAVTEFYEEYYGFVPEI